MAGGDRHLEPGPADRAAVQRLLRLLSSIGAALMLVVIVSSAFLRLEQAGLSCADWPACYGRIDPDAAATTGALLARFAHRVAASAVGIALLAALLIGATQRPWLKPQVAIAAAALAIALGLAALGAGFPTSVAEIASPPVVLANLGGGFALFALLWLLRLTTLPPPLAPMPSWLALVATLALLAEIVQITLGTLVSAKFAALACPAFPACGSDWPAGSLLETLNPFAERVLGPGGAIARPAALAGLHWLHRLGALFVLALGATLALPLLRVGAQARRLGAILAVLLVAQPALGAALVLAELPLALAVAHNAGAALLLATLVTAVHALHASAPPS
ncbi:MAG TPA: COX15/CtaA family protein [Casimicrobiaceae bacterium]